jgi:hypothetical protein
MKRTRAEELRAKALVNEAKRGYRAAKARYERLQKRLALPPVPTVYIPDDYTNPVSLNKVKYGSIVYKVRDPATGRVNFYNKTTFWKLMIGTGVKNNYQLLMAIPKNMLFRNPVTRGEVKPRNVERVRARAKPKTPSKSAAARKIQSAVRAHLKKKKAAKK